MIDKKMSSTYEKLFSVSHSFSTPWNASATQSNKFTFMFERHRKIIMKINKNESPIKIRAAEDHGYSFVIVASHGASIKQEDSNVISFDNNILEFKIFHNEKLVYENKNFNNYFSG